MPKNNPLRLDPTRTTTLRNRFVAEMNRRFASLKKLVTKLIVEEDVFGIKDPSTLLEFNMVANATPGHQAWRFRTDAGKLTSFNQWFQQQVDEQILSVEGATGSPWTNKYVDSAYRKGAVRAYTDTKKETLAESEEFYKGSKKQFLESAFAQPERVSKLRLLYTRTFEELKGVTAAMAQQMSRTLASGIANGLGAEEVARQLNRTISDINIRRARTLARTELVSAHAEGQLDSMKDLGVEEVGVMVEWQTAGDGRVCPLCRPMAQVVLAIDKARGMLPRHPNCRCAWIPAIGAATDEGQKLGKEAQDAISDSLRAEFPKVKLEAAAKRSRWIGRSRRPSPPTKAAVKLSDALKAGTGKLEFPALGPPKLKPKPSGPKVIKEPKKKLPQPAPKPLPEKKLPKAPKKKEVPAQVKGTGLEKITVEVQPEQLGGSTGAKLVKIDGQGGRWVMKTYDNGGGGLQAKNEFLANKLYESYAPTTAVRETLLREVNGKPAVLTRYLNPSSTSPINKVATGKAKDAVQKNFVTDAWLSNWDVVGLDADNILYGEGTKIAYRVDNGGSLLFRAQGGKKGKAFGNEVKEIITLRDKALNPSSAKYFGDIPDAEIIKQIDHLEKVMKKDGFGTLDKIVRSANMGKVQSIELRDTLMARYEDLLVQRNALKLKPPVVVKKAIPKPIPKAKEVPKKSGAIPKKPEKKTIPDTSISKTKEKIQFGENSPSAKKVISTHSDDIVDAADAVNLTIDEDEVLGMFTGGDYKDINNRARIIGRKSPTGSVAHLDTALEKLPGWDGISFRGVKNIPNIEDKWRKWTRGQWAKVEWEAFSSSSISAEKAFESQGGYRAIIRNRGRQGRYVEPFSSHKSEKELLYKRHSQFRVVGYADDVGDHKRTLILEEIKQGGEIPLKQSAPKRWTEKEVNALIEKESTPRVADIPDFGAMFPE